ncbi:secretion protein HylD [Thiohalobacter sp. COW1]|uniref:HlyD family secretion protein n=1 Tax=Thiohalobacter sp. COW1 TaxID=2795687 RepID=UPI00191674FE|nr:efflux RND transporter periplasmic adaptor subunit [Thiohalobacter sp. COW1]BCO31282.1 secretion protein HylD [Thiohalobacter sp. COW1]
MAAIERGTRRAVIAVVLILAAAAAYYVYERWIEQPPFPPGLIQANGRLEGDQVIVAAKQPGRIARLLAREGDAVTADATLVVLDDAQVRARVAAAQARAAQARRDAERLHRLRKEGTASVHESEEAELAAQVAEAQLAEATSRLNDLTLTAPASGTITRRLIDAGEVVAGGAPLLVIVNLDRPYLKVYVPEAEIGKLRLGLPAQVYTDAFPERPFPATVRYIASRAEFTPKEVQTPDERVKLVYAVKLYLDDNPEQRLTPGLPADAVIRWQEDAPWAKPRW